MSFIKHLREVAQREPNLLTQKLLRDCADNLVEALDLLNLKRDTEALKSVNGHWARAAFTLDKATPIADPSPPAGRMPVARAA